MAIIRSITNLPWNHHFTNLMIISFMHIPVSSRNGFILILIFNIPNEPLRIIISDTWETLHTRCHICTSTGLSHKLLIKT
ncbi:hypothetical protein F383_11605 [Gossypium arboreum]|uniref:Uncharacterized protein n=1 Tax=Gossypium arboreum TaxID=29729 RepID=A0A0B0PT91_GOSAR|nr:hypothetical protein F383_11605 [Gossypium arboreum]